jgi:sugar/nucleoside kinase (ribokinase family)
MTLSELHRIESLLAKTNLAHKIAPGGSACNTIVGFSRLGGKGSFIGACGSDEMGLFFETKIKEAGVQSLLKRGEHTTGRVLSIITPDAQRTMFTHLGAAGNFHSHYLKAEDFANAGIVYIEGYLLFNEELTRKVIHYAKAAGAKIALDLASFQVVQACRGLMEDIIENSVDIILANEDEAKAFTGLNEEDSLKMFGDIVDISVIKLGARGALLKQGTERVKIDAKEVKAIDTTGAGDLWASGFLYGLVSGYDLHQAGKIGAVVASEVVSVVGAHISDEGWNRILKELPKK